MIEYECADQASFRCSVAALLIFASVALGQPGQGVPIGHLGCCFSHSDPGDGGEGGGSASALEDCSFTEHCPGADFADGVSVDRDPEDSIKQ